MQGAGFRVQGSGFRVQGAGFRGQGFRVQGAGCERASPETQVHAPHGGLIDLEDA